MSEDMELFRFSMSMKDDKGDDKGDYTILGPLEIDQDREDTFKISDIAKIRIEKDEVLLVRVPSNSSRDEIEGIARAFNQCFDNQRILILPEGVSVESLSMDALPQAKHPLYGG